MSEIALSLNHHSYVEQIVKKKGIPPQPILRHVHPEIV
jgi:hypothetical protein